MSKFFNLILVLFIFLASVPAMAVERIISVGGDVTEIIYALGEQERIVGTDTTSYFPPEANQLPKVGYKRALVAEGILSLKPDLIIHSGEVGPKTVLQQLEGAGVKVVQVDDSYNIDAIKNKIGQISEILDAKEKAASLISDIESKNKELESAKLSKDAKKSALFILGHGGPKGLAAGKNTPAEGLLETAGVVNVITQYEGFKPINPESLITLDPDYILVANSDITKNSEVLANIKSIPGIDQTKAGKNDHIIIVESLSHLGFGPRTPDAALKLNKKIYQ